MSAEIVPLPTADPTRSRDRIIVKGLRLTPDVRVLLEEVARDRRIDLLAVETLAPGPTALTIETPCGTATCEGLITRDALEAAIAKARCEVKDVAVRKEGPRAAAPAPAAASGPEPAA